MRIISSGILLLVELTLVDQMPPTSMVPQFCAGGLGNFFRADLEGIREILGSSSSIKTILLAQCRI